MSFASKRISMLQRINYDCSIFDSLNLKCFLLDDHVNVLINPVSGEKPVKESYYCFQLIHFLSKISFHQREVEVSINSDICIYRFCKLNLLVNVSFYFVSCMRSFWDCILFPGRWGTASLSASLWFSFCTPTKIDLCFYSALSSSSLKAGKACSHYCIQRRLWQRSLSLRLACAEFEGKTILYLFNYISFSVPIKNF